MIIQCEQCRTKFRLDDEKVSDRGVKVRCAKCRHVFTVRKDAEQVEAAAAPSAAPVPSEDTAQVKEVPVLEPEAAHFAPEPAVAFDFGAAPAAASTTTDSSFDLGQTDAAADTSFDFGDVSFGDVASAKTPTEADFGEMTMVMPPKQATEPVPNFSLDFGDALATTGADVTSQKVEFDFSDQQTASVPSARDVDLGGFDFGEATGTAAAPASGIDGTDFSDFAAAAASPKAVSGDLGFSFDDAVPQATTAPADSFDFSGVDFGHATPAAAAPAAAVDTAASAAVLEVDAFSLEEMDFSGDTAAVAVAAAEAAPSSTLFEPVEGAVAQQQVAATPDITFEAPVSAEEAPPLAITSRRRQSSTVSMVIGVIAVVIAAVLGYMVFSMFGKDAVPVDDGKITVQNVKAYFILKGTAGELLVITGDALNNHKKARAALQVKGMVYGANNQTLANKTAYAGNPLSQEQLASMTAEKIEAAMNNQFGDSLANLEVQPGKTIPFTIVIINPPKEGKEFGVEPVGSTVAASK